ncbi:hypothetical protein TRFO_38275 [Tritrichomonas foetus]|uniref:BEACH domain-containing protein n=1 Tax=Tritrichomonas foetus TaxID=1144522 RepID=A0A1J4JDU6_9EUKA|nr:hypothetical protein TRFO_38275 [Tritrichomonas foetus]|eukprot:OHS95613.1 hypothetical protein TRFO_38275 [Tritrichomonas foetus]
MIHSSNFPLIFVSQPTVLEILNIFTLPPYLNDQIPPIFGDFLRKNPMPKIDKIQINQINEKLKNNYSITMSLSPIEKDFTYNQSMIIFYIRNFSTFSKYQNSAILCLMYSVISFLSTKDLSTVSSSFPNLLDSIILSKSILPKSYYIFSLSSCIVHYIEDNSFPFTPALVIRSFPTVNKDFYDLFTFVLAHALKKCEEESITHLVKTFTDAVNNNPNEFIECDFTNILSYLSQKIMGFDQLVLELIDSLSYVKNDDENIKDCMKTIPIYFSYHTPSTFKICEKPIKPYDKPKFFRFSYEFETESYFSNGLIPLPSEFFDKDYPINFNIDNVLKSIVPFLKKLSPGYFNYFFEMFPVSDDTKYLFFINLLCELSNKIVISSNILMKMLNPIVFSPHITLFNYKEEYNTIFAFRKKIFSMILAEHQNVMPLFLSHFDSTPLLFAEFIGRLHCNLSLLDASLLTDEATMNSIVQVMMFLKEEKSEIYQKARSTFYLFLFSILRDENSAREMFFASSIFVGGYFTSILEPTLHSSILNSYLSFLQQCTNPEILRPSIDMMCSVINFCDDVEIAYSVLNMFIKTLSINQKIASKVTPFVDCITAYLHTHPSQKFLNETIQLYLHCEYQFEMRQIRELSNSIHKINGNNDPDDGLISNMLCLISNIPSASINSRFSIQNETLLIAFFSIFKSAEKAKPIFDLFSDLCHFSSYNCYQCSRAEIDLLFIEMVRNYPNKFHFRGCKMNSCIIESKEKIIDLLCFIACVYCSPPVCLQIISLFQTFDTNLLNKMLANLVNIRKNIQPIGLSNNQVFMSKYAIKGKEIDKKFSFQFWVKVDAAICHYSDCIINIFKIVDGSLKMSLMINNNGSLIVRMESDYGASSAMLKQHFPSSKNWNLVSIVFKRKEGVSSVLSCSINSGKFDNFTVDFPHFSNNYIEIYVGTVESIKPIKSIFPIFLGEFWFYTRKLNPEEVVNYYQKGGISNDFIFQNSPISKYVFPNFLDVFMTTKIHQFILPFFYLSEGEMKSMFLETLIDILKAGISYIKKVDIDFKIYAFALKKSPFITFSLYQRFFSILDCSLNQATFKSLVYDILLNFGIWCNTNDPSHLHRIVQHWGISLFNACSLVLNNFSIVFSQIALYFPFNKKLNIDIDVHLCRSYIDKLLLSMATVNFTEENALAIISQCAQSNDSIQTLYDFDLLYKICLSKKDLPTSLCKILFYFLKPKKEKQFIAVLKIIYVIANEKFTKYVDLILCIFNNFYITKELFDGLLEILPDFPLIYPIIIFLALNLDYNELDRVSNALKSLKISSLATNWLLMPLLLFAVTRSVDVVIFCSSNMIDNFTYDAFEYTLSFIDFLSEILDINFEDFTLKFTKIVVDFLNNDNIIELQKIFAICARLLLLNTKQSSSFDYVDETAPIKFEFRSSIDSYIKILDKDISESRLYFRISQSPLLTTAIRLFPKIKTEIPLMKVMCHFFVNISNKTRMTFPFLTSLNSMFPFFYENASENFMKKLLMFQNKQIEYWNRAKEYSIK